MDHSSQELEALQAVVISSNSFSIIKVSNGPFRQVTHEDVTDVILKIEKQLAKLSRVQYIIIYNKINRNNRLKHVSPYSLSML